MGRKPLEESNEETQVMDLVAQSAEAKEKRKQEINARFLEEGEHYSLNTCLEKARVYQEQMASGMLGLGAQLLLLKANEVHGNFMAAVEMLGLSVRSADYAMSAALKFGNSQTSANLNGLGKEKIRALTVLDDDSAQDLANGGEVDGLGNLDDVASMTVRELKSALRKLRSEHAKAQEEHEKEIRAVEEVVRKKESKISELEMEAAGRTPPTKEQLAAQRLDEMRKSFVGALSVARDHLTSATVLIANAQEISGVTVEQLDKWIEDTNWLTSLLDDTYQQLAQDMENIHPAKQED